MEELREKYAAPDGMEWYEPEICKRVDYILAQQVHSYSYAFQA